MLILSFLLFKDLRFTLFLRAVLMSVRSAVVPMTSSLKVLFGGTMHLMVHQIMPGSPSENTTEMWRQIRLEYDLQQTPSRFGQLKLSMFNPKGGAFFFSERSMHLRI